jgi:hypothetical protein
VNVGDVESDVEMKRAFGPAFIEVNHLAMAPSSPSAFSYSYDHLVISKDYQG